MEILVRLKDKRDKCSEYIHATGFIQTCNLFLSMTVLPLNFRIDLNSFFVACAEDSCKY